MSGSIHWLSRDDEDGRDKVYIVYHRCRKGADHKRLGLPKDLVEFWVYSQGLGMPTGVPFPVTSECPACQEPVTAWFGWREKHNLIM